MYINNLQCIVKQIFYVMLKPSKKKKNKFEVCMVITCCNLFALSLFVNIYIVRFPFGIKREKLMVKSSIIVLDMGIFKVLVLPDSIN